MFSTTTPPHGAQDGMVRPWPRMAKEAIFKALAGRYFFFGILTWLEIWRA